MTKLLEQAFEAARGLPPAMQDEMARVIMAMAGNEPPVIQLTAEEEASLDESLAQAERGEFASDEQVRAIWAKHGL
ncbi:MAG: hypothetical protein WAK03_02860 [Methylocystis sp.]|jgi:predicted transcriptional regulator